MPPHIERSLGWKAFFGLLMLLQGIATAVAFRTFDSIQDTRAEVAKVEQRQDEVVIPKIREHDQRLFDIERSARK